MDRRRPLTLFAALAAAVLAACSSGAAPEAATTAEPRPAATETGTPTPEPRTVSILATGDVLLHERLWNQARDDAGAGSGDMDFAPMLDPIRPLVEAADLAVCHLEVPLAPEGGPYRGYPAFSGPPQVLDGLVATGYDACTTASNHTFDAGADGVDRTLDALDAAGLAHAGSARSAEEAAEPSLVDVETEHGSITVGLLSFTYGFNGIPYPNGEEWRSNVIDEERILADAAATRAAGAEVVVLAMHWGTEYVQEPNADQLDMAPRLIASPDVDLLLGHHAHVVQPVEQVDGGWVVYGLGNLMAAHRTPGEAQSEGLLVQVDLTEQPDGTFAATDASYAPLLVTDAFPVRVLDVGQALVTGEHGTAGEQRLRTAWERTTEVVESRGGAGAGLRPITVP
ncbi:MAG TPA: CapA family protein [Jiangellales bacterium]|nr:CapA family protein [Jiangellales bacterium]